jgi:glutaredoxin
MSVRRALLLLAAVLVAGACGDDDPVQPAPAPQITVYGSDGCGWTVSMKSDLDESGLAYIYKDVDVQTNLNEMWSKVFDAPWYESGSSIGLPIVDVKGTVLERPSLEEITTHL